MFRPPATWMACKTHVGPIRHLVVQNWSDILLGVGILKQSKRDSLNP